MHLKGNTFTELKLYFNEREEWEMGKSLWAPNSILSLGKVCSAWHTVFNKW